MLLTLTIVLGYGQLLRFDLIGLPLYLHDLIVCLYLLVNCQSVYQAMKQNKNNKITAIIIVSIIVSSISAVAKYGFSNLLVPGLYLLRLVSYLLLMLTLSVKSNFKLSYLNLSGLIALFIGLIQYLFVKDMRYLASLGWDDHLNRLIMPFYDPSFTGVFLAIASLFAYESKNKILQALYLPSIILTYARSVWLSYIFSILITNKSKLSIIAFIVFGALLIYIAPKSFGEGTNLLRTYSIDSRVKNDFLLIEQHKWDLFFGIGYNSFAIDNPSHSKGANSSYLQILLTTGVFGLVATLLILYKLYQTTPYRQTLVFVMIASLFNNVLLYPPITLYLILLFTAPSEA